MSRNIFYYNDLINAKKLFKKVLNIIKKTYDPESNLNEIYLSKKIKTY